MKSMREQVQAAGVSIWLDDLSRARLESGSLAALIAERGITGVTTNPSIFAAAINGSQLYRDDILALRAEGLDAAEIVTELTASDVRQACDLFMPTFIESNGVDGRVSIEVDPRLAYQAIESVNQGKFLHALVNRPNLLIKVPATQDGLLAIEELTAAGISVNVTLIFGVARYRAVIDSYLRGLERRLARGLGINQIHSVASFFISRLDTELDAKIDAQYGQESKLRGTAAVANAVAAYGAFEELFSSSRWTKLAALGANLQRPLWASTGVKDKSYSPVKYVTELLAPNCVNTMPEATLNALEISEYLDQSSIKSQQESAKRQLRDLAGAGIDVFAASLKLEDEGVAKFEQAWNELLSGVDAVN